MKCNRESEREKLLRQIEKNEAERRRLLQHAQKISSARLPELAKDGDYWARFVNEQFGKNVQSLTETLEATNESVVGHRCTDTRPRSRVQNDSPAITEDSGWESENDIWPSTDQRATKRRRRIEVSSDEEDEYSVTTTEPSNDSESDRLSESTSSFGPASSKLPANDARHQEPVRRDIVCAENEPSGDSSTRAEAQPQDKNSHMSSHDADDLDSDGIDSEDLESDDLDSEDHSENELEIKKIRQSKLTIALQGLKARKSCQQESKDADGSGKARIERGPCKDGPAYRVFNGREFQKGQCYRYQESTNGSSIDTVVGIVRFCPNDHAKCVLIVPFEETFLGIEEEDVDFSATYKPMSHVRVHDEIPPLPLINFGEKCDELDRVPSLVYEPQTPGSWQNFAYYFDERPKRCGRRETLDLVDLFAGCGGMHQGFKNAGFTLAKAVESDPAAVETFTKNHQGSVYPGDVEDFLRQSESGLVKVDGNLHGSPPCKGFSGANRLGGRNDSANNQLSMLFVHAVRIFQPTTASFENVVGMWRRKHIHYLKNILVGLMKLDYQVRCCKLMACDYGDPQKRPRLIILAARRCVPLPRIPPTTHGEGVGLQPYVTTKDALGGLQNLSEDQKQKLSNMAGKSTTMEPGSNGLVRLDANGLAPAIRAASVPPFHYEEDRCINVREAAALQSFPIDYVFCGTVRQQYQQIGNAVPVKLATAVAQVIREVLEYRYEGE